MGFFDKIKELFGDSKEAPSKIDESALSWAELLWEPVKRKLQEKIDIKMSIPKGKAYALCPSAAHKGIIGYVITYSVRDNQACVRWEVPNGEALKDIIEAIIAAAHDGHPVKKAVASQGKRDKNKWVWSIVHKIEKDDNELIDWYSETLAACYAFLEAADFSTKRVPVEANTAEAKEAKRRTKADMEGELPGVFTLKNGRKICFSQGHLQFNSNTGKFKFSDEQYEKMYINLEVADWEIEPDENGWIDVFGWGTSGYMGCQPIGCNSTSDEYYGPATGNLTDENANYDWGIYNPISNGGNKKGLWRTPSMEEFKYILEERPDAAKLKFKCRINHVSGTILLPDDFKINKLSIPIDFTADNASTNSFDVAQWKQLESLGCVFITSSYWLSNGGKSWAYRVSGVNGTFDWNSKYKRFHVRLVKDIE